MKEIPTGFILNVHSDDSALLIGKNGNTMMAIEYIFKLILRRMGYKNIKVVLNIDGYLERKNEKLIKKAKELAAKVRTEQKPILLKLPANERRVVHIALQDEKDIETESYGEGVERVLSINPRRVLD